MYSAKTISVQNHEPAGTTPLCSFTVDVEDWYQSSVDFDAPITERVLFNMDRVLQMLERAKVKGTFFVQGLVAKKFPRLLQRLIDEGHEVQSHGHTHRPLHRMNRRTLRNELEAARKSVEDACGLRVTAFRAPDFSIVKNNLWALEVLAECGFELDSSIFPRRMNRYGIDGWNCCPHRLKLENGASLIEAPVAMLQIGGARIPIAGGGYFRLLPGSILRAAIKRMLGHQQPVILYCHPYEFNPGELNEFRGKVPRGFLWKQGMGRRFFEDRMFDLLTTFPFARMDQVISQAAL